MKERPILFSAPMVRAILAGRKTVTRRLVNERDAQKLGLALVGLGMRIAQFLPAEPIVLPPGVGPFRREQRLWVREAWSSGDEWFAGGGVELDPPQCVRYRADGAALWWPKAGKAPLVPEGLQTWGPVTRWRPSIFMPRWASRLTLEVTAVRVERLQDITEEDASAEGCDAIDIGPVQECCGSPERDSDGQPACCGCPVPVPAWSYRAAFANLWDGINGKPGKRWADNPWIWALSFRRVEMP